MNKKLFEQYVALKIQANQMNDEIEELKPKIILELQKSGQDEVELDSGIITLCSTRTWKYPEALQIMRKELEAKEKEAQQVGIAEYIEKFYPKFNAAS